MLILIVKEYKDGSTKIRIHDDYFATKDDEIKNNEAIISLFINNLKEIPKKICKI